MKTIRLAAAAMALGATQQAAAQEAPANDVIVTAQQAQKQVASDGSLGVLGDKAALETPFNVTSYTAQMILDQQSETIGDVLENDPSVRTTFGFGNQAEQFVIRGFALFGDDVAIDGLYGIAPRQLVSPELYERVQVLAGANAFLFGAAPGGSGIGGTINLVPKRAERSLFRATASYSQDSIFGGNADVGTRFGGGDQFGLRLNGVYRKGDAAIDREQRDVKVVGASFDFRQGPGRFFLDVGYERQHADAARPIVQLAATSAVPRPPRADANYAQDWSFTTLRDLYALARVELDLTKGVTLYAGAGFRDGSEDGEYSTLTVTNGATGAATGSRLLVPRQDNNESGQAGIRANLRTGAISHAINAGGTISYTENRNSFAFGDFPAAVRSSCGTTALNFCTNIYTPALVAKPGDSTTPGFVAGSLTNPPRVLRGEFKSVFVSDTIGLFDDRLLVTAGLRRQNIVVEGFNRTTLARTTRYDRSRTTPVAGIVVRPTDTLSFYANRIEGLAQGPTAPVNANTLNPGQVFAPYRSIQYEVGGKIAVRGMTATLAAYQTRQPNAFNAVTPTTANPNATTFVVDGEQRNRGLELSFNGEPSRYLRLIGGASINDARLARTLNGVNQGKEAIGVPDWQANFGVEVVPPFLRAATLTGRVVHTADQWVDLTNTREIPAWTRFDLGVRYVLVTDRHPLTLRVAAENVGNKSFWYSAFGGYLVQGNPRTIKASATFEF